MRVVYTGNIPGSWDFLTQTEPPVTGMGISKVYKGRKFGYGVIGNVVSSLIPVVQPIAKELTDGILSKVVEEATKPTRLKVTIGRHRRTGKGKIKGRGKISKTRTTTCREETKIKKGKEKRKNRGQKVRRVPPLRLRRDIFDSDGETSNRN